MMKKPRNFSNLQVWIPAQGSSQRIPDKNIRPFYDGKSLLQVAIEKLVSVLRAEQIWVSSESEEVKTISLELGVNFIHRERDLTGNKIRQEDLFKHFISNTPLSELVAWVQVTDPLFDGFYEFLSYEPAEDEVYSVATALHKHAFFKDYPINFNFGKWHPVTQEIEPIIIPRWSAFLSRRTTFEENLYHFGKKNSFFLTEEQYVDIDYPEDFLLAQELFAKKSSYERD